MVAERILDALKAPFDLSGRLVSVHASIGIAVSRRPHDGADALVRDADVAMYTAKASGKGSYAIFQPQFYAAVVHRHAMKGDLQRAVDEQHFVLHYQPIVDLATGQTTAIEALDPLAASVARACPAGRVHPIRRGNRADPADRPLGARAVNRARCSTLARDGKRRRLPAPIASTSPPVRFSSPASPMTSPSSSPRHDLPASRPDARDHRDADDAGRRAGDRAIGGGSLAGVHVALDDFGTGWSSMSWLRELPVDALEDPQGTSGRTGCLRQLTGTSSRAIVTLGHSLRLDVVAEGIEYADQVERLRDIGVHSGQGFFFTPPVETRNVLSVVQLNATAVSGGQAAPPPMTGPAPKSNVFPGPGFVHGSTHARKSAAVA